MEWNVNFQGDRFKQASWIIDEVRYRPMWMGAPHNSLVLFYHVRTHESRLFMS